MAYHDHKCGSCSKVWGHNDQDLRESEEVYEAAHKCPNCGHDERERYWATEEAKMEFYHKALAEDKARINQILDTYTNPHDCPMDDISFMFKMGRVGILDEVLIERDIRGLLQDMEEKINEK